MKEHILRFEDIGVSDRAQAGGKAYALARLARSGLRVPGGICVTVAAYRAYAAFNGLDGRVAVELGRKDLREMRWEEMWDANLRIRNYVQRGAFPAKLRREMLDAARELLKDSPAAVRSSAPAEDSAKASFAGVHDSFVGITGAGAVLDHIRLVWASLWSDAALMYRKEFGGGASEPGMAVVVQKFVRGDRSGVAFSVNPLDPATMVIESVPGLNKDLVDGVTEPHRWIIRKKDGALIRYRPPGSQPHCRRILSASELREIIRLVAAADRLFNAPQDVEWTFARKELFVLQSRPITARGAHLSKRGAYDLSLRRSFADLQDLKHTIERELVPEMVRTARRFAGVRLDTLNDGQLARETGQRIRELERWNKTYWDVFIPFGHGMRLFGQVYNDKVAPDDPHEFVTLLAVRRTMSAERNDLLKEMARAAAKRPDLLKSLRAGKKTGDRTFDTLREKLFERYAGITRELESPAALAGLLEKMAKHPGKRPAGASAGAARLERRFYKRFTKSERPFAKNLLELGRSSYAMRDDDNVYLSGIELQLERAVIEARRRLKIPARITPDRAKLQKILQHPVIAKLTPHQHAPRSGAGGKRALSIRQKQARGQPAARGIARGKARVIAPGVAPQDFKPGEVLVCDATGPEMAYLIPLAAAVVERRGGMLIHGAIVAREYGIPCVTGVPGAAELIRTGDTVTVNGYLGLVTIYPGAAREGAGSP
jgi:pyruvate,water dikinase